jgi:signal transduction histidine kinase
LAQEARGAARALREGVSQLRQTPGAEPRIVNMPSEAPPVETTLDALDDAISMLSDLNTAARGGKARRGRIDLAALLMDMAPNTRIAIEPGAGTEVFGDEQDLKRMLNLLVTQAGSAQAGAAEVNIRRQAEWVKISVELGPDAGSQELERRWLSRMATRHGGWIELEGGTQAIFLPADGASDQREVVELRKELEQAQQLGEAYARELATVLAAGEIRTEPPPPMAPRGGSQRFETLHAAALGMSRTLKGLVEGLRSDASLATKELGESSPLAQNLQRRAAAAAEVALELSLLTDCPFDEAKSDVALSELVRSAAAEAEPRAARHGVSIEVKAPKDLRLSSRPKTLQALVRALLIQAIAATPRDGEIVLCAYTVETGVLLTAQDGGPSVTEAHRDNVVRNRTDPSAFGRPSGIALLIAEAAAESLGGRLELRDGPDGQAELWTLLPR